MLHVVDDGGALQVCTILLKLWFVKSFIPILHRALHRCGKFFAFAGRIDVAGLCKGDGRS